MKTYNMNEKPLKVFGVPFYEKTGLWERVPEYLRKKLPRLEFLGIRCPGARIGFRTNSKNVGVKITLKTLSLDVGMAIFACQSANVLVGNRKNPHFAALINPPDYNTKTFEKTFCKSEVLEDITVFLPRNEIVENVEISVDDGAIVEAPTPYKHQNVVFYGSSITEGGCCTRPTNAYTALLSNRLNFDFYNLGFSGAALGEPEMADYINTFPMSVFVYDYDHNAPNPQHLAATHEPFFLRIREKNPNLPIIMLTKPDFDYDENACKRREIIRKTFENAKNAGDKNVYFIDGESFFGKEERYLCTVDGCHPNDLGFYRMANAIEPVLSEILNGKVL